MKRFKTVYIFLTFILLPLALLVYNSSWSKNWSFFVENKIGSKTYSGNNIFFDDKSMYFSDQEEKIYALNKKTGSIDWVFDKHKNSPFTINILDNIYVTNFDSHVYSLNKQNGKINWSFEIPNNILPDTEPIADDNDKDIFFGDRAGTLFALDKKTGIPSWTKQYKALDNRHEFVPNSIHFGYLKQDDNNLFVENGPENKFEIVDKATGRTLYSHDYKYNGDSLKILKDIIVIRVADYEYLAIDRISFKEKWSIHGNPNVRFNLFTFKNHDTALVVENGLTISKTNASDNSVLWYKSYLHEFKFQAIDILNNQIIIGKPNVDRFNSQIEVLDWETGKVKWIWDIPSQISSVEVHDNKIFVNTVSRKTIIFDAVSGTQLKEINTQDTAIDVSSFDNYFLIVTKDQRKKPVIYCLSKKDLGLVWTYKSDTTIDPLEIYQNEGRLYFIDDSKKIIQSLEIGNDLQKMTARRNFKFIENFGIIKPGLDYKLNTNLYETLLEHLKKFVQRQTYILRNYLSIFNFNLDNTLDSKNVFRLKIMHNQNLYSNYFTDVKVKVLFTDQQNKSYLVNGYYYDFNTWMVNFMPPRGGRWKWRSIVTTPFTSNVSSGDFFLNEEYIKDDLQIIGKDMMVGNNVFFPVGIQDSVNDKNYDGNILDQMGHADGTSPSISTNDNAYISFDDYIKLYKKEAGLNFYRINIDNFGPSLLKNLDLTNFELNINDAKAVDSMLTSLDSQDYKIIMSLFGFYPPFQDSEKTLNPQRRKEVETYLDYMIARYGDRIDIWEIANEATIPIDWQNYISDYILEHDIYKHPITISWDQKNLKNSDLLSIHWYAEIKGVNNLEDQLDRILSSNTDWNKVMLITEFGYKNLSYFEDAHNYMRVFSWLSIFNRLGIVYWNQPVGVFSNPDNANIYLGDTERKYLSNLQTFMPEISPPLEANRTSFEKEGVNLYQLKNQRYTLGYLINQRLNCQKNIDIEIGIDKPGVLEFFDTVSGKVLDRVELTSAKVINIPNICLDLAFKITHP